MKPHAFVAMPFGTKSGPDGQPVDFNRVYEELIRPAVEAAGLQVVRADEEMRGGDIRPDMFQELLVADLVLADLTLDNPNVWYELGVRHALRARGVVLVCGGRTTAVFDLYTDRKEHYGIKDGGPDPATLKDDKRRLAQMVRATMQSWQGRKLSPVYQLLPNLQEPDWKSLRVGNVLEFWERHDAWAGRIEVARRSRRIGDLLVLAGEAPVATFRADAWIKAGKELRKAQRFDFALEQLQRGLEIDPRNLDCLREQGICLQRLALAGGPGHSLDRAREHYRQILRQYPRDPETWALLGRVDKDAWIASWRQDGSTPARKRADATGEEVLLRAAIDSYAAGHRLNPAHYYSGINALTLMHLHSFLTGDARFDRNLTTMAGAVRFAAECETDEQRVFWAKATLGDLEVLVGTPDTVEAAYTEAIANSDKDWFALDSTRAQLLLLDELGFRAEVIAAGIATFDRALDKLTRPKDRWQPRQVFLFSGHMIDAPSRSTPRFPDDKEPIVAAKIAALVEELGAGPDDVALTQGACGGDLLFTEACQQRGVKVQWLLPFREPEFIEQSVIRGGDRWRARYFDAKAKLAAPPRCAPDELGVPPSGLGDQYPYERCNLWLLYTVLALGVDKLRFLCLWDGGGGDGPGGTAHMYQEVKRRTGRVYWLDTRTLW